MNNTITSRCTIDIRQRIVKVKKAFDEKSKLLTNKN